MEMVKQRFPASLSVLSTIRQMVAEKCREIGLAQDAAYRLTLAVDEIATNIITHGYEEHGLTGDITLSVDNTSASLEITLEDMGVAYDPRSREMPTHSDLEKSLDERDIGGLGIFLAIQGVDRFEYHRLNDVNYNRFVMNID